MSNEVVGEEFRLLSLELRWENNGRTRCGAWR